MDRTPTGGAGFARISECGPIAVVTEEHRQPTQAVSFPSVQLILVREGAAIVNDGMSDIRAETGDVVVVRSHTIARQVPDGQVKTSTLYGDSDYMFQHWYWGMQPHVPNPDVARALAKVHYTWGAKRVRLGEPEATRLGTLYDQLHDALDIDESAFYLAHGLVCGVIDALFPHLRIDGLPPVHTTGPHAATPRVPGVGFGHPTVREVDRLLSADLARAWVVADLAQQVHISSRQLTRDFRADTGMSPMAYLGALRVREMVRLIAEEDLTVEAAAHRVGWKRNHATAEFQRHMGINPGELRRALHAPDPDNGAPDIDIFGTPRD
ncbi:helix-turn-helix domain-containing protein [Demequina iriomotensis]|uniref:helix-turn-helix domain-containing protein n=1 Tax=Demequina iriomotensis TaxID=1536641 RepID=UPI000786327C|nr:AraC family transcriptional regulator [Demequina iriomotensis]